MNASDVWTDLGGNPEDRWACIGVPCPNTYCLQPVGVKCRNPITEREAHAPCMARRQRFEALGEPSGDHPDGDAA